MTQGTAAQPEHEYGRTDDRCGIHSGQGCIALWS